jgi:hypothetical protein
MKIIVPMAVTEAMLTTNIPITESLWTAGTYAKGIKKYLDTTLYEVVAASGTSDTIPVGLDKDEPTWAVVGAINKMAMFDQYISWATDGVGDIEVSIAATTYIDTAIILNAKGKRVRVRVDNGTVVYDQTKELKDISNLTASYWAWGFEPILPASDATFFDLPLYSGADILVDIEGDGAATSCGVLFLGRSRYMGETIGDMNGSIIDYSRKERNVFGDYDQLIKRGYSLKREYEIKMTANDLWPMESLLASLRTEACVWIGEDNQRWTLSYGRYTNITELMKTPDYATIAIEVEGLT